jgi:phosphate starvation-inducible membrane PsiE
MASAVLTTHSIDLFSEAFNCKKEISIYFILTQSLKFFLFLNYDAKHTLYVPRGETVTAAYIHKA